MPETVADEAERYEGKVFWERINAEFSAMREDPGAWKHSREERSIWDATLSDGLDRPHARG
ncbi:MAG TPA: hypothetical protein VFE47_17645 [Tepidisphaeraceae bacterium]|nr:hypothetical protein [Tepidisphaeraceae bacterium]